MSPKIIVRTRNKKNWFHIKVKLPKVGSNVIVRAGPNKRKSTHPKREREA
jgi:hypothetical protein